MADSLPSSAPAALADLAAFPEMNPGPVIRTDLHGRILLVNAAARSLFGAERLAGTSWLDVCPGMTDDLWRQASQRDRFQHEAEVAHRVLTFTYRHPREVDSVFIYGNDITELRQAEEALRQAEKMATLGTLAAGVAHELNNPAAAATRGAEQLREAFAGVQQAFVDLTRLDLTPERAEALVRLAEEASTRAPQASALDAMARSDREYAVETWLEDQGVEDAWELAPALVSLGHDEATLAALEADWDGDAGAVAIWLARAEPVYALARDIAEATGRISEIVKALKTYSYLGQAPVRPVDVTEGIESTLVILRSKLKAGITVHREYASGLPQIEAVGSELNQVWTNLIDNAADAMGGRGHLTIRTRHDGDHVAVEIEDDGPGIPAAVQTRVFDPFFTTKAPGKGTGLGLSTSHNIVVKKHGGTISVTSRPGSTRFTIRLPLRLAPQTQP